MSSIANAETIPDLSSADLDYDKYLLETSAYEFNLVTPTDTADKTFASASNGQTLTWYLEPGVYNLGRSYVTFNLTTPAVTAGRAAYYHATTGFFNRATLTRTSGGNALVDLQFANKYISAVARQELSLAEISSMDSFLTAATLATSQGSIGTLFNFDYVSATGNVDGRGPATDVPIITNYQEPKYIIPAHAVTVENFCTARVPLSMFLNTMLALDKAFYVSERLTLQLTLDGTAAIGYQGTTIIDPIPLAALGACTLSNAQLYLAMVSNQLIAKEITRRCVEGQDVIIPNVTYTLVNNGATTSQNPEIRITRANGKFIKKLFAWNELATPANTGAYYSISNCDVTKVSVAADVINITDGVVKSFVTRLNGKQVENAIMVESNARKDSYNNAKKLLDGSAIMSARSYYYNWCYRLLLKTNYSHLNAPQVPGENNIVGGVEIGPNGETRWQVQATTSATALNWYLFAALDKPYRIQNGIFVEM